MRRRLSVRCVELLGTGGAFSAMPHSPQNLALTSSGAPQVGQAGMRSGRV